MRRCVGQGTLSFVQLFRGQWGGEPDSHFSIMVVPFLLMAVWAKFDVT